MYRRERHCLLLEMHGPRETPSAAPRRHYFPSNAQLVGHHNHLERSIYTYGLLVPR